MSESPKEKEALFIRHPDYDRLLAELNRWLNPVEEELIESFHEPQWPTIFVVGLPRSGTTLLMQLLAASGGFSYPSNLLARFYGNLYLGARVELLLQKILPPPTISFSSTLGKTRGWNEPNEFGFFWESFFPLQNSHELSAEELASVNTRKLVAELAAFEQATGRPVAMKAMLLNFHLSFLQTIFPRAIFIQTERPPLAVAISLLKNRVAHYGGMDKWLSCKPRNWQSIMAQYDPADQVAIQVKTIATALRQAQEAMPAANWLTIPYEKLCAEPHLTIRKIADKLASAGHKPEIKFSFPEKFTPSAGPADLPGHLQSRLAEYFPES